MFDWQLYIKVAYQLLSTKEEAFYRSAISRAYYAAYNITRAWAIRDDPAKFSNPEYDNHYHIWQHCKSSRAASLRKVGEIGARLRITRNKIDYENAEYPELPDAAGKAISSAETIIQHIRDEA